MFRRKGIDMAKNNQNNHITEQKVANTLATLSFTSLPMYFMAHRGFRLFWLGVSLAGIGYVGYEEQQAKPQNERLVYRNRFFYPTLNWAAENVLSGGDSFVKKVVASDSSEVSSTESNSSWMDTARRWTGGR